MTSNILLNEMSSSAQTNNENINAKMEDYMTNEKRDIIDGGIVMTVVFETNQRPMPECFPTLYEGVMDSHDKRYRVKKRYSLNNGASLQIKRFPIYKNLRESMIEFSLGHFRSYVEDMEFLQSLFPNFDLEEPIIRKLTLGVNLNFVPASYFRERCWVKRKRYADYNETENYTIVYGKQPERIKVCDVLWADGIPDAIVTIVEVEYAKKKLPITKLSEIESLCSFNPYKNFVFAEDQKPFEELLQPPLLRELFQANIRRWVNGSEGVPLGQGWENRAQSQPPKILK